MISSPIDHLTTRLSAAVKRAAFGDPSNVVPVVTKETAEFFGRLMVSALQSSFMSVAVADGEILVWAIAIGDNIYGAGATVAEDNTLTRIGCVFARFNKTDTTTVLLDRLLDEVFDAHNQDIAAASLAVAM